jgi:hypothetical protein
MHLSPLYLLFCFGPIAYRKSVWTVVDRSEKNEDLQFFSFVFFQMLYCALIKLGPQNQWTQDGDPSQYPWDWSCFCIWEFGSVYFVCVTGLQMCSHAHTLSTGFALHQHTYLSTIRRLFGSVVRDMYCALREDSQLFSFSFAVMGV